MLCKIPSRAYRSLHAIAIALLLVIAAPAQSPTELKPGFNLFTKQQDIQLGKEAAAEVRKKSTIVNDPVLTAYVNEVGKRLAASREAKESGFPFTFEVVADPAINAFALPGGPMFINTGLLKAVDNEAQLAGVMGHEMSHVILRHGTNQASKANLIQIPLALAGQLTDSDTLMGELTQLGIGLGADSVLLKFSRTDESQADLMGSHLMAEGEYDPVQMARFFKKLNSTSAGALEFLADHPNPENRSRAIREEAARLPHQGYGYQTGEFQKMKQAATAIHEPPKPKQD
ncbi:MAG TPA: M48 family metallopeptidase [Terriglobales bacterium]|nr:M48 family metallopeptidase [Terriglobales bacterium]